MFPSPLKHFIFLFFFFALVSAAATDNTTPDSTETQTTHLPNEPPSPQAPPSPSPSVKPSTPPTPPPVITQQGVLTLLQPSIPYGKQERFKIGDSIRFEWTFDKNLITVPKTLGFALFAVGNPQKVVVISTVQPNLNFTWASSKAKDELTEGDYVLKIWDSTDGSDEKTGPTTIAPPGRLRVEQSKTMKFYRTSQYVNDQDYCPTCLNSAGSLSRLPMSLFLACWALHTLS